MVELEKFLQTQLGKECCICYEVPKTWFSCWKMFSMVLQKTRVIIPFRRVPVRHDIICINRRPFLLFAAQITVYIYIYIDRYMFCHAVVVHIVVPVFTHKSHKMPKK